MRISRNLPRWARVALPVALVWDIAWKGAALWQAARRRQPIWFVCLLGMNTVGILPITYLLLMRRRDQANVPEPAGSDWPSEHAAAGTPAPEAE
jgi:Family of unknown function (DUF5652)